MSPSTPDPSDTSEGRSDRLIRRLTRVAHGTERRFDALKSRLGERFGGDDPIRIVPYLGYGTPDQLYLRGRVIEDEGITPADEDDSIWLNLLNTYRRFESDEVPGARVLATFQGQTQEVVSDEEGYFELEMRPDPPPDPNRLWHEVELELLAPLVEGMAPVRATGHVMVPPAGARFGIISDVDDTVVHTNATSLLKMGRIVFMGNARTRLPFEGVAAFYEALQEGASGQEYNPLFYVSSSPWNLYEMLTEFFEIHDIPIGPLMLRDWGISSDEVLPIKHAAHKIRAIRRILESFDHLPFILIGDSGQEDPEIYADLVAAFPDRIRVLYIRNVSPSPDRRARVMALAEQVVKAGSILVLADDTLDAARHALDEGLIAPDMLDAIRVEKAIDEASPPIDEEDAEPHDIPTIILDAGDERPDVEVQE